MNKSVKTKLENEFGIFNIHNFMSYSGNYWLGFEFQVSTTGDHSYTTSVMVRSKESIREALQRVLNPVEDDGCHD
ncbi:hypothetical protein [Roseateles sp. PN1]|uniref:hypothetical protein n=1 Tax=Roseateles sp. PN1 TaxID=3137372 RepID=UPI00313881F5